MRKLAKVTTKAFKAGEMVWHKKQHRWAVVVEQSNFRHWVQVLFVGDDTPHDAFSQWLEKIEDNKNELQQRRLGQVRQPQIPVR